MSPTEGWQDVGRMLAGPAGRTATRADRLSAPAVFLGLEHLAEAANRVHKRWQHARRWRRRWRGRCRSNGVSGGRACPRRASRGRLAAGDCRALAAGSGSGLAADRDLGRPQSHHRSQDRRRQPGRSAPDPTSVTPSRSQRPLRGSESASTIWPPSGYRRPMPMRFSSTPSPHLDDGPRPRARVRRCRMRAGPRGLGGRRLRL